MNQVQIEFVGDVAYLVARELEPYAAAAHELVVLGIAKVVKGWDTSGSASPGSNTPATSSSASGNILIIAIAASVGGFLMLLCLFCMVYCFACRRGKNKDGLHVEDGGSVGLSSLLNGGGFSPRRTPNRAASRSMRAQSFSVRDGWLQSGSNSGSGRFKVSEMLTEKLGGGSNDVGDGDDELEDLMASIEEQRTRDADVKALRDRSYSRRNLSSPERSRLDSSFGGGGASAGAPLTGLESSVNRPPGRKITVSAPSILSRNKRIAINSIFKDGSASDSEIELNMYHAATSSPIGGEFSSHDGSDRGSAKNGSPVEQRRQTLIRSPSTKKDEARKKETNKEEGKSVTNRKRSVTTTKPLHQKHSSTKPAATSS